MRGNDIEIKILKNENWNAQPLHQCWCSLQITIFALWNTYMPKNDEKIRQTFGGTEILHYLCPRKVKYIMIWTIGYQQEKNFCSEWKLQKKESVSDLQKWKFAHVNCSRKELVMNRNLYIRYESIGYRRNKQAVPLQSKQGPYYRLLVFCNKKRHTVGNWLHWRRFDTFRRVLSIWNQQCQQSAVTTLPKLLPYYGINPATDNK